MELGAGLLPTSVGIIRILGACVRAGNTNCYSRSGRIANTNFQAGSTRHSLIHEGMCCCVSLDQLGWTVLHSFRCLVICLIPIVFLIYIYIYICIDIVLAFVAVHVHVVVF